MKKIEKMLVNAILDAIDNSEGKFVVDAEDDVLVEIEGSYKIKGSYEPYGAHVSEQKMGDGQR